MKLFITTLLASFAVTVRGSNPVSDTSTLSSSWNMDNPTISFNATLNTFTMVFNTTGHTGFDPNEHINEDFYDVNCKTGDGTENPITSGIVDPTDGTSRPQATQDGTSGDITLTFQIQNEILTADTDLYTGFANATGELKFCVRTSIGFNGTESANGGQAKSLAQQITDGYREVNFIESLVTVNYDLSNNFEVTTVNVEPKEKATAEVSEDAFSIMAWLCDPDGTPESYDYTPAGGSLVSRSYLPEVADPNAYFNQGALISVCVRPINEAYAQGIVMDEISSFTWSRTTGIPVDQEAIAGGSASTNLLTYYDSCSSESFCRFSSILFADFYISQGVASGSGTAKTKFAARRRLGAEVSIVDPKKRSLQDSIGGSAFDIKVVLDAAEERPGSIKTAGGVSVGLTALSSIIALGSMLLLA